MSFGIGVSSPNMGPRGALEGFAVDSEERGKFYDHNVVRRLLAYVKPYSGRMTLAFFAMLIATSMTLLTPYLLKLTVDQYIRGGDAQGLLIICLWTAAAFVGLYISSASQHYLISWVSQRVLTNLRKDLFTHIQKLSLSYHQNHIVGVTVSRVMNDVATINELLTDGVISLLADILILVGIMVIMLLMNLKLALLAFTVLPLMVLVTLWFSRQATSAFRKTRTSVARVVGDLAEDIAGVKVIQAFSQEDSTQQRFKEVNTNNRSAHVDAMRLSFIFLPAIEFLGILATAIVLWFGGRAVSPDGLTIGVLVAFLSYVTRFFSPIQELSRLYTTMQSAMASGEQVLRLLDTSPEVQDAPGAKELPFDPLPGAPAIEFDQVTFRYQSDLPDVLHDINLKIPKGQTLALVGPTGAGKTSIGNLIARFYDTTRGSVRINGMDVREVTQKSLHRLIGLVPQDSFLFAGTIAENIQYGRPGATVEEIFQAARNANAHDFILSKPEGYNTHILESATNLSLGQRQLLCIARAILADPAILILDEATANIDSLTEGLIQKALSRLLKDRTAVVIAHRLSTIQNADSICVIAKGRIVEQGTHAELLSESGMYARLYRQQFTERK